MLTAKFALLHAAAAFDQAAAAIVVPLVPPPAHDKDPNKAEADATRAKLEATAATPRATQALLASVAVFGHDLGAGLDPTIQVAPVVFAMEKVVLAYDGIAAPAANQKARRLVLAMTADKLRVIMPPNGVASTVDAMRRAWQALIAGLSSMQGLGDDASKARVAALLGAFTADLGYLKV